MYYASTPHRYKECKTLSALHGVPNREMDSNTNGTSITISIFMTFIVTAIAVTFFGIVVG